MKKKYHVKKRKPSNLILIKKLKKEIDYLKQQLDAMEKKTYGLEYSHGSMA